VSRPSKYPEQFRRDAVELVRTSGRPVAEVARELGINHETLRTWVIAAARPAAVPVGELDGDERAELGRLRRKVAELEAEKEILRKAAAYFAKEMGR
jgi:transposase